MWLIPSKSVVVGAMLAATLLGAETSQAAIYTGSWDPAFGPKFPNLYWKANATFDIPTACLAQADNTYLKAGACAGFQTTGATLSFYANAGGLVGSFLESFTLNPSATIQGIEIVGGQLAGVNTNFFAPITPGAASATYATDTNGPYAFSLLLFGGNLAQLAYISPLTNSVGCVSPIPGQSPQNCGYSENNAVGQFALAVPEPGTYALMLAGISVVGFAARRRRSRK